MAATCLDIERVNAPIHEAAHKGYGEAAEVYARARPPYPEAAANWIVDKLGDAASGEVVEVGAGTGKFTTELVSRGYSVIAVEPVLAMRERLAMLGSSSVQAIDATAESLPFEARSVRRIVASQSLHWADVERAFAEFERVLEPSGLVVLVWNFRDTAVPWQADLDRMLGELRGNAPHSRDGRWQRAVKASSFEVTAGQTWNWSVPTSLHGVLDRVRSVSYIAALDEKARLEVDDRTRRILRAYALDLDPINFAYTTEAYVLKALPG